MKLPQVISHEIVADHAVINIVAGEELPCFQGHFSGNPVLPGVVQIGWAIELAESLLEVNAPMTGLRKIKFNRIIRPGVMLHLHLAVDRKRGKLQYRYADDVGNFSSGEIVLGES